MKILTMIGDINEIFLSHFFFFLKRTNLLHYMLAVVDMICGGK